MFAARRDRPAPGTLLRIGPLACALATLFAPSASPAAAEVAATPDETVETVEVRLLEIAIEAVDGDGRPVPDLAAGEIEIESPARGKRGGGGPLLAVAGLRPAASPSPAPHDPVRLTLETGTTSVTFASGADEPRYFVFLIDVANLESARHERVREDLKRYVREQVRPQDVAAVLSFTGQVNFEAPFHSDPAFLEEAVERAFARPVPATESATRRMRDLARGLRACEYISDNPFTRTEGGEQDALLSDEAIAPDEACVRGSVDAYVRAADGRAVGLASAFLAAVRLVGGIRDEATVYAVSPGVAADPSAEVVESVAGIFGRTMAARMASTFAEADRGARVLDEVIAQARRDRVVIHVVDPDVGSEQAEGIGRRGAMVDGARPTDVARQSARATVGRVADASGGRFVRAASVAEGLATAADARRGRYLLHVMSDAPLDDDDVGALRIGSNRRRIDIRSLQGGDVAARADRRLPGTIAIDGPRVSPPADDPGGASRAVWSFSVSVPVAALGYLETNAGRVAELTLHVVVQTADGRELVGSYAFLHHAVPRDQWDAYRRQPVTVHGSVDASEGEYRLIAVVRNAATGAAAEMIETLAIRDAPDR